MEADLAELRSQAAELAKEIEERKKYVTIPSGEYTYNTKTNTLYFAPNCKSSYNDAFVALIAVCGNTNSLRELGYLLVELAKHREEQRGA